MHTARKLIDKRIAPILIMLVAAVVFLCLLGSPAPAHGEGQKATFKAGDATYDVVFKEDVLVLEDNSNETGGFTLTGRDTDNDEEWDLFFLKLSNSHPAAQAKKGKVVFIKNGDKLHVGKVTDSAVTGSGIALTLSSKEVGLNDYAYSLGVDIKQPIYFDERIAGAYFTCENDGQSYAHLIILLVSDGWGYKTTISFVGTCKNITVKARDVSEIDHTEIRLFTVPVYLIPGVRISEGAIGIWVEMNQINGNASFDLNTEHLLQGWIGLEKSKCHLNVVKDEPPTVSNATWDLTGSFHIGPFFRGDLELAIDIFKITTVRLIDFYFSIGAGVKAVLSSDNDVYKKNGMYYHECNAADDGKPHCMKGALYGSFMVNSNLKIVGSDPYPLYSRTWDQENPFEEFYYSSTFDDGGFTECPHLGNRLYVTVQDPIGLPVSDAEVSYSPVRSLYEPTKKLYSGTSDAHGQVTLYVPGAKNENIAVTVTAKKTFRAKRFRAKSYTASVGVVENGPDPETGNPRPESVTIVLDCYKHVFFKTTQNVIAEMPEPVQFNPFTNICVRLPDMVPEETGFLSGNHVFVSWNTKPDGSGETYYPGDSIGTNTDVTLYAQWKDGPVMGTYFVVFNANGGTKVPDYGIAYMQADYQIPAEGAVWDIHTFKGWALNKDAFEADFQPGETVSSSVLNPGKDLTVTLYAVWTFDPVDMPCHLTYDMNGGPESEKPAGVWAKKDAVVQISDRIPYWNQLYSFAGWSRDKDAAAGEYLPGSSLHMEEDITLYAIWRFKAPPGPNRIEFRDTGSGTATNMPATVFFEAGNSTEVNLPDTIPEKPGLYFIGWNTSEDGSGTVYMPGARLAPTGDMILYARWHILSNQYSILYNPNGGTSGPSPQFATLGEPAILSSEPAVWEHHEFLGWSKYDDATVPEYPAGQTNTLVNPDDSPVIMLYAVWGFSPVDVPVRLSFDMNGGPAEGKPKDQKVKSGSWVQIPAEVPVWNDLYLFNGWSTDPHAAVGEYDAGMSIKVEQDTTLYAIWHYTPADVPICVSYHLNGGLKNQPEPQVTRKNMLFGLSPLKPSWDGQHTFLGWSLNRNDTKPMYQPGQRVRFLWDTDLYAVWNVKYRITEGNGSTWKADSKKGLRFEADGRLEYFRHLVIDGKTVSSSDYVLSSGSTVVDLKRDYLRSLGTGTHTIRFMYFDGRADGTFTVQRNVPRTGDASQPAVWIFLMLAGSGVLTAEIRRRKK